MRQCLCCAQVIPGNSMSAISALAWVHDADAGSWALISAGLSGQLECWDPQTLACTSASDSFGGAVWAMAVQPTQGMPLQELACFRTVCPVMGPVRLCLVWAALLCRLKQCCLHVERESAAASLW